MPEITPLSPDTLAIFSLEALDKMTGEITQEDIDHGIQYDHKACPLARAIQRMFPEHLIFIDDYVALSTEEGEIFIDIAISEDILIWIDAFDNNKIVEPINFVIKF